MRINFAFILVFITILSACVDEHISADKSLRLQFSVDTVVFDTVLSGQMSATRRVMLRNPNKKAIRIDEVSIGGGELSFFRFNVDGRKADNGVVRDVLLRGGDSVYVFVETTPRLEEGSSVVVTDSLRVVYNGNISQVYLAAVACRVNILRSYVVDGSECFADSLPYLVFDYIHVPSGSALTLKPGVTLLMHGQSNLVVEGRFVVEGSLGHPVVIRGDRYDEVNDADHTPYNDMPNQWGGIYLQNNAERHLISYAVIRSARSGLVLVGSARGEPQLDVSNSVVHNMGDYGIYVRHGKLNLANSEVSNCGEALLAIYGGEGYVAHTTLANYFRFATRKGASVVLANWVQTDMGLYDAPLRSFVMENSIVFGSQREELLLSKQERSSFNVLFSHCLIKGVESKDCFFEKCRWAMSVNSTNGADTVFVRTDIGDGYYDFRLDSLSHAIGWGSQAVARYYPTDLDGRLRNAVEPDLGAYQRR